MKKMLIMTVLATTAAGAFAWPHCPGWRPGPPPPPHYYHGGGWGPGGCNFWPGFVGGVIGGAVARTLVDPAPVVVTQPVVAAPVVVTQPVVTQPVVTQPVVTQPVVVTQPASAPVVVSQPVTQMQNVWVEGRYIDQVQSNGSVVRVWNPGHYEQRPVVTQ